MVHTFVCSIFPHHRPAIAHQLKQFFGLIVENMFTFSPLISTCLIYAIYVWSHCIWCWNSFFSRSHSLLSVSHFILLPSSVLFLFWHFGERNRPKIERCRSMARCYRSSGCQSTSIFNVVCGNVCTLRHENRWKIVNVASTNSIMLVMSDLLSFCIHRSKNGFVRDKSHCMCQSISTVLRQKCTFRFQSVGNTRRMCSK